MRRRLTGQYHVTQVMGEKIRAFVPHPLPPNPPLVFDAQRQKLLTRATLALGRLDSINLLLPDPNPFVYAYARREAVFSSQIEGLQSTLTQLLLFELDETPVVPFDDVVEVSNYVAALTHGLERLRDGFPLSNRLLREMHAILLRRGQGSEKSPGEFRRSQNWIGGTRPGNAHFVPPPASHVEDCMARLERFIHDKDNPYPALVKAALAHVQFETIHPFLDGNGRIGRLLIAFILRHDRALSQPLLCLSLFFKQHRSEYYRLLDLVRAEGDWEAWLDFFLEGVEQTANSAVDTAKQLLSLFNHDKQRVQDAQGTTFATLQVFSAFCRRPLISVNEVSQKTDLSFPTVNSAVRKLKDIGILHEITGKRRNRIFAYQAYLDILNEGTEMPLNTYVQSCDCCRALGF